MNTIKAYIYCGKKYVASAILNGELTLKQGELYAVKDEQSFNISRYLHIGNTVVSFQDICLNDIQTKFHNSTWDGRKIWFDVEKDVFNTYFSSLCRDIRNLIEFVDGETLYKRDIKKTIEVLNSLI
jgi:hypothetical protein